MVSTTSKKRPVQLFPNQITVRIRLKKPHETVVLTDFLKSQLFEISIRFNLIEDLKINNVSNAYYILF